MANLFSNRVNNTDPVAIGLRVSASVQGAPVPIGCGQTRWAPVLVDYAGFTATPTKSPGSKGGLAGAMGKGNTGQYTYTAWGLMLLGEGLVGPILTLYNGSFINFLVSPSAQILTDLANIGIGPTDIFFGNPQGVILHEGTYTDTPDASWQAQFGARALAYRGWGYIIFPNLDLGSSPTWPAYTIEAPWQINSDIPALGPDANPSDWFNALLTNQDWGIQGFPAAAIGDFATAKNYWRATGLLISTAMTAATAANSHMASMMDALNADFRWSGSKLDIVPRGDVAVTGNGYAYTPNTTPVYTLGIADFLPNQGTLGNSAGIGKSFVAFSRGDPADIPNNLRAKYLDRSNLYNPVTIYEANEADINASGRLRLSDLKDNTFFCLASAAGLSISLQLQRLLAGLNLYQVTVGRQFVLLDALDLVTLTYPPLQLTNQLCRINEIQENADSTLTLTMEAVPLTASAPVYARQASLGAARNANAPPGSVNTPYFFEPPDALGDGLALLIGLSGSNAGNYGGCQVQISSDGTNYELLGPAPGATRMGVLTAPLASVTAAVAGNTVDSTNTLAVDLTESLGELVSVSPTSFAALSTICVVDNEIIIFQTATLTAANKYSLTTLIRGAYGSTIASHAAGAQFMRLDGTPFQWDFPSSYVGQTVYFKFLAYNSFGVAQQNLADVGAYPYVVKGIALSGPLPSVGDITSQFTNGFQYVYWDEVVDFRPVVYEIRQGSSWMGGLLVRTQAHPPFIAPGNGTYWIAARSTPVTGLTVYSLTPESYTIAGNLLTANIVETFDEQAAGWPGTLQPGLGISGVGTQAALRLGSAANILATNPILTNGVSTSINFAAGVIGFSGGVPAGVQVGWTVADVTHPTALAAGTTVSAVTATTVTLSSPITAPGVSGDTFRFSIPDIFDIGGVVTNTPFYYTSGNPVDIGYVAQAQLNASTVFAGVPVGSNVLALGNVLTVQDILGSVSTQFISGWVEINIAQANGIYAGWQKFVPGQFSGQFFQFRVALETSDPNSIPFCTAFNWTAQVPARIDHYQNQSVPAAGLTIVFQPDGAAGPGAFNGGPAANNLPYVNVAYQGASGEYYQVTALSLSQMTITFFDSTNTAILQSGVNIDVEGF